MKAIIAPIIAALIWAGLVGGGYTGGQGFTYSVASQGSSPIGVNSISSCATNPADTVIANTDWTSASTKYLAAPTQQQFIVKSQTPCLSRDQEVTTWGAQGYVFLRLDAAGRAIYFFHDVTVTGGYLEIGLATGVNESSYPGASTNILYQFTNLVTAAGTSGAICHCNYTTSATDGQTITFGVQGFQIYVKINGTTFLTFNEYRQMSPGAMALKASSIGGNGFRDITYTTFPNKALYSNISTGQLDLRDFGLRSIATTGSITAGQNTLTVASAAGFQVNDVVVVEIGGESGLGARGTVGVGGTWPAQSYLTAAAMNADTSQPQFTFGWINDGTGIVKEFNGQYPAYSAVTTYNQFDGVSSGGINYQSLISNNLNNTPASSPSAWASIGNVNTWSTNFTCLFCATTGRYYASEALPMALVGRINSISGNVLTLGNPTDAALTPGAYTCPSTNTTGACATATNANVYLDNAPIINDLLQVSRNNPLAALTPSNITLNFPEGTFSFAGPLIGAEHTGWGISGAGQSATILRSINGTFGAGISTENALGFTIQNLTLNGNVAFGCAGAACTSPSGYGLNWVTNTLLPLPASSNFEYGASGKIILAYPTAGATNTTQTNLSGSFFQTSGIYQQSNDNGLAQNLTINNTFTNAYECLQAVNCGAINITLNLTYQTQSYTQYQFEWAQSTGGYCNNCKITSTWYASGPECFESAQGPTFTNFVGVNTPYSMNSCSNFVINGGSITFQAMQEPPLTFWTATNPLVALDQNAAAGVGTGGIIENVSLTTAYIDATHNVAPGIVIAGSGTGGVSGVTIQNVTFSGPGFDAATCTGAPCTTYGNSAVRSQANTLTINGLTAQGTTGNGDSNINFISPGTGGLLENSTFDTCSLFAGNTFGSGNNHTSC